MCNAMLCFATLLPYLDHVQCCSTSVSISWVYIVLGMRKKREGRRGKGNELEDHVYSFHLFCAHKEWCCWVQAIMKGFFFMDLMDLFFFSFCIFFCVALLCVALLCSKISQPPILALSVISILSKQRCFFAFSGCW